ncbi:MAG TPA: NifU N-terminal domain-containing protein, partial [Bacteroidia bacterium]
MNTTAKIPVVIYAESTPNPSAMKFVSNKILLETLSPMEFMSAAEAKSSPLAIEIFNFPFVKSVFISGNYITITKSESIEWSEVLLETREFLRIYLSEGKPVVTRENAGVQRDPLRNDMPEEFSIDHSIPQTETEKKIVGILEQYVTPAVGQDGGMIV